MPASRLILLPLTVGLLAGCGSPSAHHGPDPATVAAARELGNSGARYEARNEWASARAEFKAAAETLGEYAHPSPLMVSFEYEYARCLGVTGHFKEAEEWLKKARDADEAMKVPTYMDLTELARLNLDQKKYAAANLYFEQLFQQLDHMEARETTPAAYCFLLREYSRSLEGAGHPDQADEKREDIAEIRSKHAFPLTRMDRTPYGKYPDQ